MLKFPYPRCVDEPETYDMIRVHAEWGSASQQKDIQSAPTFAVSVCVWGRGVLCEGVMIWAPLDLSH